MKIQTIIQNTYNQGQDVINTVGGILECEAYCAQAQVYIHYLKNKREEAELYFENFREFNDKIFSQAMEILDIAIGSANTQLAESALETIKIMKNTYPDFYNSYHLKLLGQK